MKDPRSHKVTCLGSKVIPGWAWLKVQEKNVWCSQESYCSQLCRGWRGWRHVTPTCHTYQFKYEHSVSELCLFLSLSYLSVQRHEVHSDAEADPLVPSTPHQPVKRNFLKRELGLISTTALTLNMILGSGILITPSSILRNTGSFGLSLVLWGVGGVITYAASFCYLELALLIKKSGSTYIYIKEAYSFTRSKPWMEVCGSFLSFLLAWSDIVIGQPSAAAIAFLSLGRYTCRPFFIECDPLPMYAVKSSALFALSKWHNRMRFVFFWLPNCSS